MSKIKFVLGIDTSNYTTSAALYDIENDKLYHARKLLPVAKGGRGLRQSDAVFHHTAQLSGVMEELYEKVGFVPSVCCVGVSAVPRDAEGSYMPCFTVGVNTARCVGAALGAPVYEFSHQAGHISAAVYSSENRGLFNEKFIAFHVSGGTTEAVFVSPDEERGFCAEIIGKTLDLHAGQVIDRVGVKLGMGFPCGQELEKLALRCGDTPKVKICVKGCDCCLSGVENICAKMAENNVDSSVIARTCLEYVEKTLEKMCENILEKYGDMPVLFAGGVMSDSIIREELAKRFGCLFASAELSSDNACGTAVLAARRYRAAKKGLNI